MINLMIAFNIYLTVSFVLGFVFYKVIMWYNTNSKEDYFLWKISDFRIALIFIVAGLIAPVYCLFRFEKVKLMIRQYRNDRFMYKYTGKMWHKGN